MNSRIGYLLSGPLNTHTGQRNSHMMHIIADDRHDNHDLERFWKLESLGIYDNEKSDKQSDTIKTSITYENDKYVAKLPWIEDLPELPTNEILTLKRTERVVTRLSQDSNLLKVYGDIIRVQESRGFIVSTDESNEPKRIHYIPHHSVKKHSTTTPIRIVYDCSCKENKKSSSLNDCLHSYPPITNDITEILTRFCCERYAVTTDIEKAVLQVSLHPTDRDVTRFFWLSDPTNPTSPFTTYRFTSVLFGATCSPFILNATLLKHFGNNPSSTSERLKQDLYVDNVLTSFSSEKELVTFYREARDLLSEGGFNLRSWTSNSNKLREIAETDKVLAAASIVKILAMLWNRDTDKLSYQNVNVDVSENEITKREMLRQSSKIFDPLGLLSLVSVKAKILMQSLWKRNFGWDECLPDDISDQWNTLAKELKNASSIEVPRLLNETGLESTKMDSTSLQIFIDASQSAYGACAYLVQGLNSQLVMAKNRVPPLKTITLPRLELMAALLGAKLAKHVSNILGITNITFWGGSQIVLSWLYSSKTLKQFVANKVNQIRELVGIRTWRYCPTDSNPADLLTRGIQTSNLKENKLWFNGPEWLLHKERWPEWERNSIVMITSADTEQEEDTVPQPMKHESCDSRTLIEIGRFSSYQKLLRVVSYILRFMGNCRKNKMDREVGPLQVNEIQIASHVLIRSVQQEIYKEEIKEITSKKQSRIPIVRQLRLYIDENGLLRSGGRINNAAVCETAKYPYLLP